MRSLKYYVASTLDGFIAREDGSFDGFVFDDDSTKDYLESLKEFDTVLMGRKTYDVGLKEGVTNPYPTMKSYVVSRSLKESPDPMVELISENVGERVKQLKNEPGQPIYLCGGADLSATLFAEGLIDEVIIKLNPVAFGSGIPLISPKIKQIDLVLTNSKAYPNGLLFLYYQVKQVSLSPV